MDETIKDIRGDDLRAAGRDHADAPAGYPRARHRRLVEEMTPMLGFAPSLRLGAGLRTQVAPGADRAGARRAARGAVQRGQARASQPGRRDRGRVSQDGILSVQVTDNGVGIPEDGRRSGLRNLASRAEEKLGGDGVGGGLGAAFHAELGEQRGHVVLHGLLGQEHPLADLPVGQALADQLQDPAFLVGQGRPAGRLARA
jgi:hypothetical protein